MKKFLRLLQNRVQVTHLFLKGVDLGWGVPGLGDDSGWGGKATRDAQGCGGGPPPLGLLERDINCSYIIAPTSMQWPCGTHPSAGSQQPSGGARQSVQSTGPNVHKDHGSSVCGRPTQPREIAPNSNLDSFLTSRNQKYGPYSGQKSARNTGVRVNFPIDRQEVNGLPEIRGQPVFLVLCVE